MSCSACFGASLCMCVYIYDFDIYHAYSPMLFIAEVYFDIISTLSLASCRSVAMVFDFNWHSPFLAWPLVAPQSLWLVFHFGCWLSLSSSILSCCSSTSVDSLRFWLALITLKLASRCFSISAASLSSFLLLLAKSSV